MKISGIILSVSATRTGVPAARISLYTGKNQDGTWKESTIIELVGNALKGFAVKDRVSCEVGHLEDVIFDKKDNAGKGMSLKGVAISAKHEPSRVDAVVVKGNLVADPGATNSGTPSFRIGVNHKDQSGQEQTALYSVLAPRGDVSQLRKGSFVEVSGILTLTLGKDGDKIFRDLVGFKVAPVVKSDEGGSAADPAGVPAGGPDDGLGDDLPF